jgi:hypothetical protein
MLGLPTAARRPILAALHHDASRALVFIMPTKIARALNGMKQIYI